VTLPNPEQAVVDPRKLLHYCLNPAHPRGRHKARLFASALGITQKNAEELRVALLRAAFGEEALPAQEDDYGRHYVVDFEMKSSSGKAIVRSSWIVLAGENFPRLTTCYVLRRMKGDGT
jgi:hypothetical protein